MSRIEPIEPNEAEGKAKELLDAVGRQFGMTPNLMKTLAHSPATLEAYLTFQRSMAGASLGADLRELIAVTVANFNECNYCTAAHSAMGAQLGLEEDALRLALEGKSNDPKTEAALQFARAFVERQGWVTDREFSLAAEAGFTHGEIAEIVATTAITIFSNYFNHVAGTEVDFPPVMAATSAAA